MASDKDVYAPTGDRRRISRYDLVLAVIPATFLFALIAHLVVSVPLHVLVAGAATVATLPLIDGLFVNPPRNGSGTP